jgi:ankyrin repeat protein
MELDEMGDDELLRLLIEANKGLGVNEVGDDGVTLLFRTAQLGQEAFVSAILKAGAEVDSGSDFGWTPLLAAVHQGHLAVVATLLKAGAAVDKPQADRAQCTPLIVAVTGGHAAVVTALLGAGAEANRSLGGRMTPLIEAVKLDNVAVVGALLREGADVDRAMGLGITPLISAVVARNDRMVATLIHAGAQVDKTADDGSWPLFCAAEFGFLSTVTALLEGGAQVAKMMEGHQRDCPPGSRMCPGTTPLSIARQRGHQAVVTLLSAWMPVGAEKQCAYCKVSAQDGNKLKQCTGCHQAWFCNRTCQAAGWKDHRVWCREHGRQPPGGSSTA